MQNKVKLLAVAVAVVSLLCPSVSLAWWPQFTASSDGSSNVKLTINNAAPYSQITLYQRQNTELWTTITNFGTTDQSGYFSTSIGVGSTYNNRPIEYYVMVAGQQTGVQSVYPSGYYNNYNNYNNNNCFYYNNCSNNYSNNSTLTFSESNVSLSTGQSRVVTINANNSFYNNFNISSNSNSSIVSTSLNNNALTLYAQNPGQSTITVCQTSVNYCGSINVNVTGNYYNNNQGNYYPNNSYYPSYTYPGGTLNYPATGTVQGAYTYKNGSLISEYNTVYITYKNTKTGFANKETFEGLGFRWSNVIPGNTYNIQGTSYSISTPYTRHPWGSWIKSGNTIYFSSDQGLIPVPSYDIFLNNGGEDRLVVNANSYDFNTNMLSPMTYQDSRLK